MIVESLKEREAEDAHLSLNNQRREKCMNIFHVCCIVWHFTSPISMRSRTAGISISFGLSSSLAHDHGAIH